jgi:aquaporin Z
MSTARLMAAEAIGTFVLMLCGPGSAVLATGAFADGVSIQVLGVSLAFGLSLLAMAYAIGTISGCHINPAVTIGLAISRKIEARRVPAYFGGQLIGCLLGGAAILGLASGAPGGFDATPANFAVNGWDALSPGGFGLASTAVAEIIFTALLVFVVLSTTHRKFSPGAGGLAVGLTLTLIHLVSIPIDNTSVNPARSLGMAVFAGGDALTQLWAFFVFPILGAIVGAAAWRLVDAPGERTIDLTERVVDVSTPMDAPADRPAVAQG